MNQSPMATSLRKLSNSSFHWLPSQCCSSSLKYQCSYFMYIQLNIQHQMKECLSLKLYFFELIYEFLDDFRSCIFSLWSTSSGATVIIHISVARICDRKRKRKPTKQANVSSSHTLPTQHVTFGSRANSETGFLLPAPSV